MPLHRAPPSTRPLDIGDGSSSTRASDTPTRSSAAARRYVLDPQDLVPRRDRSFVESRGCRFVVAHAPAPHRWTSGTGALRLAPAPGRRQRQADTRRCRRRGRAPSGIQALPRRLPRASSPSVIPAPLRRLPRARSPSGVQAPPRLFVSLSSSTERLVLLMTQEQVPTTSKMPGGSRKGKAKPTEDLFAFRGPWCVLHQGEKAVPVLQYLTNLGPDLICTTPPPGETAQAISGMLVEPAKSLMFKIISMVFRELDAGRCFSSLSHTKLFVNLDGLVKIRDSNIIGPATPQLIQETVHALGNTIDELVAAGSRSYSHDRSINPELKELIYQMKKYQAGGSRYLMQFHPCNVPDSNRGFYFIIIHDETMDVLRYNDSEVFQFVIDGVKMPQDLFTRMQQNTILKKYLVRGGIDPAALPGTNKIPKLVRVKTLRNIPSHGREDAGDLQGPFFTRADLARAVYDKAPMALCSMARGLEAAGELKNLGLDCLFPDSLHFHTSS